MAELQDAWTYKIKNTLYKIQLKKLVTHALQ